MSDKLNVSLNMKLSSDINLGYARMYNMSIVTWVDSLSRLSESRNLVTETCGGVRQCASSMAENYAGNLLPDAEVDIQFPPRKLHVFRWTDGIT